MEVKKEPKIKIFVAHHKPGYIYEDDVYVPIQVGKKNSKIDLGILGDDTGDNISEKNDNYAELTAQYWVWKNYDLSDVDYVGFCHYRRYMTYCYRPKLINYIFAKNFYSILEQKTGLLKWRYKSYIEHNSLFKYSDKLIKKNSLNLKDMVKNSCYDVYMPKRSVDYLSFILNHIGVYNGEKKFGEFGNYWDYDGAYDSRKLFIDMYPEQKTIMECIEQESQFKAGHRRHLFIMKRDLFYNYQKWLFDYLFELERKIEKGDIDISSHWTINGGEGRFMGIFSETLINYWLYDEQNRHNIKISSEANMLLFTDFYL